MEYEAVLGHMRAASVFASPSTREGFGITYAEAMAAGCLVVGADHPDPAADEVVGDAGYLPVPTRKGVAAAPDAGLSGQAPTGDPRERARQFDWGKVTDQAEEVSERARAT